MTVYSPLEGVLFAAVATVHTPLTQVVPVAPAIWKWCPASTGDVPELPVTTAVIVEPEPTADTSVCAAETSVG